MMRKSQGKRDPFTSEETPNLLMDSETVRVRKGVDSSRTDAITLLFLEYFRGFLISMCI